MWLWTPPAMPTKIDLSITLGSPSAIPSRIEFLKVPHPTYTAARSLFSVFVMCPSSVRSGYRRYTDCAQPDFSRFVVAGPVDPGILLQ